MTTAGLYRYAVLGAAMIPLGFGISADGPRGTDKRQPVDKAIQYIIAKGDAWIKERKCVSCHMIPFMVWSLNEAKAVGYTIPNSREVELMEWSLKDSRRTDPGSEGLGFLVLARDKTTGHAGTLKEFGGFLGERQRHDGGWKIGGQMPEQKRPHRETEEVVAMWSAMAMNETLGKSAKDKIDRVREFVAADGDRKSTEWTAVRLIFAQRFGEPAVANEQMQRLLGMQRKDGGWPWLIGESSDAIATGLNLYALSFFPRSQVGKAIDRGRDFLLKSQNPDGSWNATSTLAQHRNEVIPTSIYWGTTWAVIGLCRTER